jgi:hypothetical protein
MLWWVHAKFDYMIDQMRLTIEDAKIDPEIFDPHVVSDPGMMRRAYMAISILPLEVHLGRFDI